MSRQELTRIKEESFICFVCNPTPIKDDMEECKKVLEALKEYKAMESKSNSSRTKPVSDWYSNNEQIICDNGLIASRFYSHLPISSSSPPTRTLQKMAMILLFFGFKYQLMFKQS